jgi:hypothetical protein
MVRVWYQAGPHDASPGAGTRRPVTGNLCRIAAGSGGQPLIPGAYPVSPGWRGLGAHQAGPCPAGSRSCARVPGAPLAPSATWPGRRMAAGSAIRKLPRNIRPSRNIRATGVAQSFRGSRMFHANGNSGTGVRHGTAPGPAARARGPRPALLHAPAGRARPCGMRSRAAPGPAACARGPRPALLHALAAPGSGSRPASRSMGHDLAGRTAIDPGPSVSVTGAQQDAADERGLPGVLQAIGDHADQPDAEGHRRVPPLVHHP